MGSKGFEHQKKYKIRSVFDGSLLDLHNANTGHGTMIKTWEGNGSNAQIWLTNQESKGFRLSSPLNPQWVLRVIDMNLDNHVLYYNQCHGETNQQFWTEGFTSCGKEVFLIRTNHNNYAIRNQGKGNQVKCVPADKSDISQQWTLHLA